MKPSKILQAIGVLLFVASLFVNYYYPQPDNVVLGGIIINALTTGAGIVTTFGPTAQMENNVVIGDVDTANPLQAIKLTVGGKTKIDISGSQPLCSWFTKIAQRMVGSGVVGLTLKLATGRITGNEQNNSLLSLTNNGATTPTVFAYSDRGVKGDGVPFITNTTQIVALANATFYGKDFKYLAITPSANVASVDVVFRDGTPMNMSVIELDDLFARDNDTQTDGRLDAVITTLDNTDGKFISVRVNATTAVTVLGVALDQ